MSPQTRREGPEDARSDRSASPRSDRSASPRSASARRGSSGAPARVPAGRGGSSGRRDDRTPLGGQRERADEGRDGSQRRDGRVTTSRGGSVRPSGPEPTVDGAVTGNELDRSVRAQLRTLSKENAQGVAEHLVMVGLLLDGDPQTALAHAEAAVRRAGRVAAVREARGMVAYRLGDFARALSEFRTARRLSGSSHLLPVMVDCERALGRPGQAIELATSAEARSLRPEEQVELAIVVSGIRRDSGQLAAAAAGLEIPQLHSAARRPWSARLPYAYAEAQLALGDIDAARKWFARAAEADEELTTDAAERLEELDGIRYTDLLDDGDTTSPDPRGDPAGTDRGPGGTGSTQASEDGVREP